MISSEYHEGHTSTKPVRLAVIVCDFGAALHMGAATEWRTRTFELPLEVADWIAKQRGPNTTVTLALEEPSHDR